MSLSSNVTCAWPSQADHRRPAGEMNGGADRTEGEMMPRRLILLLLPPAYVLLSYYVVYERLLLAAGAFLTLRARAMYAFALSLFLLGFQAWLAGRAHGFLKLEPADAVAPKSLIFHAVLALVFLALLCTTALW